MAMPRCRCLDADASMPMPRCRCLDASMPTTLTTPSPTTTSPIATSIEHDLPLITRSTLPLQVGPHVSTAVCLGHDVPGVGRGSHAAVAADRLLEQHLPA